MTLTFEVDLLSTETARQMCTSKAILFKGYCPDTDALKWSVIMLLYQCDTCYSSTTVYYGIQERSECIPVDSGVTNLIHDRRIVVLISRLKSRHSSVNKPGVKRNSGL